MMISFLQKLLSHLNEVLTTNALFFDLFAEDTANLVDQAKKFNQLFTITDKSEIAHIIRDIRDFEHKGDDFTHKIFLELSLKVKKENATININFNCIRNSSITNSIKPLCIFTSVFYFT